MNVIRRGRHPTRSTVSRCSHGIANTIGPTTPAVGPNARETSGSYASHLDFQKRNRRGLTDTKNLARRTASGRPPSNEWTLATDRQERADCQGRLKMHPFAPVENAPLCS